MATMEEWQEEDMFNRHGELLLQKQGHFCCQNDRWKLLRSFNVLDLLSR